MTLKQTNAFADTNYIGYDKVMQFRVGNTVTDQTGNGALPATLVPLNLPTDHATIDQSFSFSRTAGEWTINGVTFSDVQNSEFKPYFS